MKNLLFTSPMKDNVFVSVPVEYFFDEIELITKKRFNVEIKIFAYHLDEYKFYDFVKLSKIVKDLDLRCTIHAPFMDLSPGSFDKKIRKVALDRFEKTIDIAGLIEPENIVFHTGFFKPIHSWFKERWFNESMKTWEEVFSYCKKVNLKFSFENVFDEDTKIIEMFIKKFNSNLVGVCFDIGHFNVFAKNSIDEWFEKFKDKIFEIHIHDNNGEKDWHWAVGDGKIDFFMLFNLVKKYCKDAILTLEAHDKETMLKSYKKVKEIIDKI